MHDIGQLSLAEPIPGGATVLAAPADQRRIAHLGADVIRQTGVLDAVAAIVAPAGRAVPPAHDIGAVTCRSPARIIKAVNAYDDLVGESTRPRPRWTRSSGCGSASAYEYDPTVVESLSKTVERTARLAV